MYSYTLLVLALPVTLTARNLATARRKLLRRYVNAVNIESPTHLPITPPLFLAATTDPRVPSSELSDPRR